MKLIRERKISGSYSLLVIIKRNTHILRHSTGYYLANKGIDTRTIQSYLGHRNIQHTVRYTDLTSARFQGLWDA